MKKPDVRVLFVDDNRLMAEGLARRLGFEAGLEYVGWVEGAADAVRIAGEARADVVVLDVDMPGDSFGVVRDLSVGSPHVKVVMLSGHIRRDYVDRAIDAGAWGYISKNETMDLVIEVIRRVAIGEFVLSPDVQAVCRIDS